MENVYFLLGGLAGGAIGGYLLATHIHSIADAAAQRVVSAVAGAVGSTATLVAAPPAPPAPPATVAATIPKVV